MKVKLPKEFRMFISGILMSALFCSAGCTWVNDRWNPPNQSVETTDSPVAGDRPGPLSVHLAFGNPSQATSEIGNLDNYLIVGSGSAFSYNNSRGTINWISWKTTGSDLGRSLGRPDFRPDPRLPAGLRRIGPYDYSGSGFDRGHMVPSADRFADPALNEETFMMTNIVPQKSALNQYPWEKLESYARSQARRGFDVYTIAGVYGAQGRVKDRVTVPTNCWKIIAFLPRGEPLESIGARTRLIAVDMPNKDGIQKGGWEKYKTDVRTIEERTGYDFFASMPRGVQDRIETRIEMRSSKP